jgi:hypothetical protein
MTDHQKAYKKKSTSYYTAFEIFKFGDAYIELIEEGDFESKQALQKREGELIRTMKCVNKRVAGRDCSEYYQEHKEERKQYYNDNLEKRKEQMKQYDLKHAEERKETNKQYYQINKEKLKQYHKEYYLKKKTIE